MDAPANLPELISEFAGITGASPLVADHYLSACNYDLNRSVEFYFEHPPAPTQAGPRPDSIAPDEEAAALGAYGDTADLAGGRHGRGVASASGRADADDDEELLQRALAESMQDAGAGPGPRRGAGSGQAAAAGRPAQPPREDVEVIDDDDDDEEMPSADGMLEAMTRQREEAMEAEREARGRMEEMMDRILGGRPSGTPGMPPPPGYPRGAADPLGGVPSIFPGMGMPGLGLGALLPPAGLPIFPGGPGGGPTGRSGRWRDEAGGGRGSEGSSRARDGSGGSAGGAGQAQRRRVEVRPGGGGGGGSAAAAAAASGRAEGGWLDDELQLPEGMSRHDLEEARMMESALLGVPYEGPMRDFSAGRAGGGGGLGGADERGVAPELLEHRELRWDQDRAYEESLAADRAKEQAVARVKAEVEARERAQREVEAAAERAAAEEAARAAAEAARVEALVAAKTRRLPAEPPSSAADAISVMVRLPDGSRHSRRFARGDRLSSVFDFVDVELDSAAKSAAAVATPAAAGDGAAAAGQPQASVKPGTYNLVSQFPRRVFSEDDSGYKTLEEAGLAGGGGAAFFIEQKAG